MPLETMPTADYGNRADVLTADIPAGGTMTARAVARMYAALMDEAVGRPGGTPEDSPTVFGMQGAVGALRMRTRRPASRSR